MTFNNKLPSPPYRKEPLTKVAIIGASGHIGGPMADYLRFYAPEIKLRLISSRPDAVAELQAAYPNDEVVKADYRNAASIDAAFDGVDGAYFSVTQNEVSEEEAMTNVVNAVGKSGTMKHMVRVVGMQPDTNNERIPKYFYDYGKGIEVQHQIARRILDEAHMPVTYLNSGASFMDNYLRMAFFIQEGTIPWPDRLVPYIDPREIGVAAARLLMSDDSRHIHQFYTINNGEDAMTTDEVAALFQEVLLRPIVADTSKEAFMKFLQPVADAGLVDAEFPSYLWNHFQYERANAPVWVPNKFLERILGRKPNTLRSWIMEHRQQFEV